MPEIVKLNGFEMRFEVHGEGTPVVYTPGALYRLESARPVAEALEALGYRVLLWDRPNTGGSGLLFEGDNLLSLWADKLHELLQHLRFTPAYRRMWPGWPTGCWPRCTSPRDIQPR